MREIVQELLRHYRGPVKQSAKGFTILCPWHEDREPSCLVWADTGFFSCWTCGTKPPAEGFKKLGVPGPVVDRALKRTTRELSLKPLPTLDQMAELTLVEKPKTLGVETREPWPAEWRFRDVPGEFLRFYDPLFSPGLVTLWFDRGSHRDVEELPRLALKLHGIRGPAAEVYLRLSTTQEVKAYDSAGLDLHRLYPFGLSSWRLDPEVRALVVVEGPYDLLNLRYQLSRLGADRRVVVVALLGTGHWKAFRDLAVVSLWPQLQGRSIPLVLALDPDQAGIKLRDQIVAEAKEHLWFPGLIRTIDTRPAEDPGKLTEHQTAAKFAEFLN